MPEKKYKWRRADYEEKTRGLLIVHTGNGKGKTTCALGLMMRAAGQGLRCCMIQFMKSRNDRYGEHVSAEKLGIDVYTNGIFYSRMTTTIDCVSNRRNPFHLTVLRDDESYLIRKKYLTHSQHRRFHSFWLCHSTVRTIARPKITAASYRRLRIE